MDEVIKKVETLGAEEGHRPTGGTSAGAAKRPGSLSNLALQVGQQNTWICPANVLLQGALLSRPMPQTGSFAISSPSFFEPATGGLNHRTGTSRAAGASIETPRRPPGSSHHGFLLLWLGLGNSALLHHRALHRTLRALHRHVPRHVLHHFGLHLHPHGAGGLALDHEFVDHS